MDGAHSLVWKFEETRDKKYRRIEYVCLVVWLVHATSLGHQLQLLLLVYSWSTPVVYRTKNNHQPGRIQALVARNKVRRRRLDRARTQLNRSVREKHTPKYCAASGAMSSLSNLHCLPMRLIYNSVLCTSYHIAAVSRGANRVPRCRGPPLLVLLAVAARVGYFEYKTIFH